MLSHKVCVFCYKPTHHYGNENKTLTKKFFKLLERFLGQDQLIPVVSSNDSQVVCCCCDKCGVTISSFCELYHQLKCLELQLDWRLESLVSLMKVANRIPSRIQHMMKIFVEETHQVKKNGQANNKERKRKKNRKETDDLEKFKIFRSNIIRKFSQRLASCTPRVLLKRWEEEGAPNSVSQSSPTYFPPLQEAPQAFNSSLAFSSVGFLEWVLSLSVVAMLATASCKSEASIEFYNDKDEDLLSSFMGDKRTGRHYSGSLAADEEVNDLDHVDDLKGMEYQENSFSDISDGNRKRKTTTSDFSLLSLQDTDTDNDIETSASERQLIPANLKRVIVFRLHILKSKGSLTDLKRRRKRLKMTRHSSKSYLYNFCKSKFKRYYSFVKHKYLSKCAHRTRKEVHERVAVKVETDVTQAEENTLNPEKSRRKHKMKPSADMSTVLKKGRKSYPEKTSSPKETVFPSSATLQLCTLDETKKLLNNIKMEGDADIDTDNVLFSDIISNSDNDDNAFIPSHYKNSKMTQEGRSKDPSSFQILKCDLCPATFTRGAQLSGHKTGVHWKKKCPQCGKSFSRSDKLLPHIFKLHPGFDPFPSFYYACTFPKCRRKFATEEELKHHQKSAGHREDQQPLKCLECGKEFEKGWRLKEHMDRVHITERSHICPHCGMAFKSKGNLGNHLKNTLQCRAAGGNVGQLLKCSECEMEFAHHLMLKRHKNRVHVERSHFCSECGLGYKTKETLKQHLETHKDPEEWKFQCSVCMIKFAVRKSLNDHMRSHTKQGRFRACLYCGKTYSCPKSLKMHVKKVHKNEETI